MADDNNKQSINALLDVMARLRDPDTGCPWDISQDFESIVPYTLEEAYEVADAIARGNMDDLKEELGDLLLQVVYHAHMAAEQGSFTFDDVAQGVTDKMISRHPHVFGDETATSAADVNAIWDARKDAEKKAVARNNDKSALDGVTQALPALLKAQKLQKAAARVGYVWQNTEDAFAKIEEEIAEFKAAKAENNQAHMEEEFGDMLFCLVNFARMNGIKSEEALRKANDKFTRRFKGMEMDIKADNIASPTALPLKSWLDYWERQKAKE